MALNPWLLLGVGIAWLASLAAVGTWQREDGALAEKTAWQAKEVAELAAANAEIQRLQAAATRDHRQHELRLAAVDTELSKSRRSLEERTRNDRRAARDGSERLRIPGACPPANVDREAAATPAPGRSDGAADAELPGPLAAALHDLANEADAIVEQLTACQAVVLSDRKESP
jgi:prophage endopeptidase